MKNPNNLPQNAIVLNRYRIESLIWSGVSYIYKARDLQFPNSKRYVAVKEYLPDRFFAKTGISLETSNLTEDEKLRLFRFYVEREANMLATVSHPNIVFCTDYFNTRDRAYLVTEYIKGINLEQILSLNKMSVEGILKWGIGIANILEYLHENEPRIIHKDIKPSSLMVDHLGQIKLLGFSYAEYWEPNAKTEMSGTEGYTAPEIYRSQPSPLSDQYSLCAMLHHLLTNRDPRLEPPFSFKERLISKINDKVSPELEKLIFKGLEFNPEDRYPAIKDLKLALHKFLYGELPRSEKHFFISYSHEDMEIMQKVKACLAEKEIKLWTDESIRTGSPLWRKMIQDAIETAAGAIVLMSPSAKDSEWVGQELDYARTHELPIYPLLVSGSEKDAIPFGLAGAQFLDVRNSERFENQMDVLSRIIRFR